MQETSERELAVALVIHAATDWFRPDPPKPARAVRVVRLSFPTHSRATRLRRS